ncbi:tripartite tricarboxylate transporter TctB family protein [Castellaniella defragrans]|uniref:DUF1468 domain-containing protein n=1 Tax=Castellaniella defragrans TaxID=75697 RepID=A0A7W9WNJ1_CASDE|nr:tripartite tricarboxylate transporter TctB family protein [Castellaniella defragrans]KAB0616314.1 tripartite tricarboxylate transporter TctB family protein [Castellaniella defragrans]MBB6083811.1 hypothetical protein [Castellaniella defragrans]
MFQFIRHPKDFWSGVMFMFFGLAAVVIGQDYPMGTAGRMGPAYFPIVLGGLLSLIGLATTLRALWLRGEAIQRFSVRDLALILFAVFLFGLLVRNAGIVAAVAALVMVSAYASDKFHFRASLILSVGAILFCVLVFVKALGLPLPVFGPWLAWLGR